MPRTPNPPPSNAADPPEAEQAVLGGREDDAGAGGSQHLGEVLHYYQSWESRLLYRFLGGTKHYGLFRPSDASWDVWAAMRRMEDLLAQKLGLVAGARALDAGCGVGDVEYRICVV